VCRVLKVLIFFIVAAFTYFSLLPASNDYLWSRSRNKISAVNNKSRYLVFQASTGSGGWGDRFRGMASAYALAQFADRDFRVHFLDRPGVDWRAGLLSLAFDSKELFSGTQLTAMQINKNSPSHNQMCTKDYTASRIARDITFQACCENCLQDDICNGVSWDAERKVCVYCASAFPNCRGTNIGTSFHTGWNTYWKQYDHSEIDVYFKIDGQVGDCYHSDNWSLSGTFANRVLASNARVLVVKTNEFLFNRIVWNWAASQLLAAMQIKQRYIHTLSALPVNITCGQYRLGANAEVGDTVHIVTENRESVFYEKLMQWMSESGNAPVHMWTDSEKIYQQFRKTHSNAINITGPILHIDKGRESSSVRLAMAFERVIIEWLLVSRCSKISQQTGFINTALFNAPTGAKMFRHYNPAPQVGPFYH